MPCCQDTKVQQLKPEMASRTTCKPWFRGLGASGSAAAHSESALTPNTPQMHRGCIAKVAAGFLHAPRSSVASLFLKWRANELQGCPTDAQKTMTAAATELVCSYSYLCCPCLSHGDLAILKSYIQMRRHPHLSTTGLVLQVKARLFTIETSASTNMQERSAAYPCNADL